MAAHLLRRAAFGPTRQEINYFATKTPSQAMDELVQHKPVPAPPADLKTGQPWLPARKDHNSYESRLRSYVVYWWMDHLCRTKSSLTEKMVYFYHTHFTTIQSRANYASAIYYQNQLFRHHALGNVKTLATKLCYDNAMLMNLDGRYNRVEKPNENFAREFLELYSIGKGPQVGAGDYTHYTEHDVKQAARVFSGFQVDETFSQNIDQATGIPMGKMPVNPQQVPTLHDFGSKTFSAKFGQRVIRPKGQSLAAVIEEIGTFVDMVFAQPETARFLCRKLYRFFVYHQITPEIEKEVIQPLATQLIHHRYEILPVLKTLLSSEHFYDMQVKNNQQKIRGTLVKSPLELVSGMLRYFKIALPAPQQLESFYTLYGEIFYRMQQQGMELYEPVDVAGYPAYYQEPGFQRNWISSSTLAYRYKFAEDLIKVIRRRNVAGKFQLDVLAYVDNPQHITNPGDAARLVKELAEDLLPRPLSQHRYDYLLHRVLLDNLSLKNWEMEWQQYKRYGTGTQASGVRSQLEKLLVAMMQTPDYQLF